MTPEEWYGKLETKPDIPLPEEKQPAMSPEEWYGKLEINPLGDIGGLSGKAGPTVTSTVPKKDLPPPVTNKAGQTFPDFLISETGKGIAGMLTTPGQAYQHGLTPEEETNWAGGMSLNMLGQTPFAPKGSAGLIGGKLSSPPLQIKLAEAMDAQGFSREQIWDKTKHYKGRDGQWKHEISDEGAKISERAPKTEREMTTGYDPNKGTPIKEMRTYVSPNLTDKYKLGDVIEHPQSEFAYPGLSNSPLQRTGIFDWNTLGGFNRAENRFFLNSLPEDRALSTLLHEIQHYIQHEEGFARGGNTGQFTPLRADRLREEYNNQRTHLKNDLADVGIDNFYAAESAVTALEKGDKHSLSWHKEAIGQLAPYPDLIDRVKKLKIAKDNFDIIDTHAFYNYQRLAGELESRMVQERHKMTAEQRKNEPPWATEERLLAELPEEYREVIVQFTVPERAESRVQGGNITEGGTPSSGANENKPLVERLPPPLSTEQRLWQNYGSYMRDIGPEEALRSEPLWGTSARLAEEKGTAHHEEFARLANEYFSRNNINNYMTPDMAKRFMRMERGRSQGIKGVPSE